MTSPDAPQQQPGKPQPVADGAEREQAVHRRLMRFGEGETLATPVWEQRGTTVRAVEAQLMTLWHVPVRQLIQGDESVDTTELAHARASVLNLIVTVLDESAAERVVKTMMGLGARHPSRAIVLVANHEAPGDSVDARISVHCQTPTGGGERVCYEQVILTVRGEAASHLAGVVAPLLIHDLPTLVWWPGAPPIGHPVFEQLVGIADRLIVDSSDFGDLLVGFRRLGSLRRRTGVGDLSWERLGPLQELTAQFFDTPRFRRYLPNLNRLLIRYAAGPQGRPEHVVASGDDVAPGVASPLSQAMLYAGWLATRLGWKRYRTIQPLTDGAARLRLEGRYEMVDLIIEPQPVEQLPPGELVQLRLRSLGETGAAEFIIDRDARQATVATNADGMTASLRRTAVPEDTESHLLSQQLVVESHELVYEAALRAAAILLASAQPGDSGTE